MIRLHDDYRDQETTKDRFPWGPVLLLVLVWGVLVGWQAVGHEKEGRRLRAALADSTQSSLRMFEAGLRSMCHQQLQVPSVLESLVDQVEAIPGVRGMWVTKEDGTLLCCTGEERGLPAALSVSPDVEWQEDGLLVRKKADLGPWHSDGLPDLCCARLADSPTYLYLLADRSEMDREIAKDLRLRLGGVGAVTLACAGAFLLLRSRIRTRRLRTELAVTEERARQNREWALLGAGLAHETKNPLAFVRGAAQDLLENGSSASQPTKRANQIVDEVDRVTARINEFLQYARPVEPDLEAVRIDTFLGEVGALAEADLAPRNGRLDVSAPPITIHADQDMLRRILLNLLVNAARAIPDGGEIRLTAGNGTNGAAIIEVRDNGHGIASGDLDRVFQPYYTRAPGGTGLGLAIVRRLAEAHGWRVELESEEGAGTVVRIVGVDVIPDEQPIEEDSRR